MKPSFAAQYNVLPPRKQLQELFDYDDTTGRLLWKETGEYAAALTGTYRQVKLETDTGIYFAEHRLIYQYHHDEPIPTNIRVDHNDRDPSNNRIGNLSLRTNGANMLNRGNFNLPVPHTRKNHYGWTVQIDRDDVRHYKHHKTFSEAIAWRNSIYEQYCPDYLEIVDLNPTEPDIDLGPCPAKKRRSKPVTVTEVATQESVTYPTIREASKATGIDPNTVTAMCRGKRGVVAGYSAVFCES